MPSQSYFPIICKIHSQVRICVHSHVWLSDPTDKGLPGSSVHGILQARTLEQVASSYSRVSSWPKDLIHVSCIFCTGRQILYHWASCKVPFTPKHFSVVGYTHCGHFTCAALLLITVLNPLSVLTLLQHWSPITQQLPLTLKTPSSEFLQNI